MCLGIPARVVSVGVDHPDLASVECAGALRSVNVGLLDEAVAPGDWVLVHLGFAVSTMTARQADEALTALGDERRAQEASSGGDTEGTG